MSSSNCSSSDSSIKKIIACCHKGTQTNNAALKDSSTTASSTSGNEKTSLKVFEFSKLVQDPNKPCDITIIKDIYTEEIHDHSQCGSDNALANRYTYCREVIKPYLKDYPKGSPVSDEQLVKHALEATYKDFPCYESCLENYSDNLNCPSEEVCPPTDKPDNSCGLKDNISSDKCCIKKDKPPQSSSCIIESKIKAADTFEKSRCKKCIPPNSLGFNMDPDKCKEKKKECPKKPKTSQSLQDPCNPCGTKAPASAPTCKTKKPPETCEEPSAAPKTEPKKDKNCQQMVKDMQKSCQQTEKCKDKKTETYNETLASIKSTVEGFINKVYQTTKEAVMIIKTESAHHLGKLTAKRSSEVLDPCPKRVNINSNTESASNFSFFRSANNTNDAGIENDLKESLPSTGSAVGKIFDAVDSTISIVSEQVSLQKVKSVLSFDGKDKSSPYDKVYVQDDFTSTSHSVSVFTTIKSKIASMFSEIETKAEDLKRKSNTSVDLSDDDD